MRQIASGWARRAHGLGLVLAGAIRDLPASRTIVVPNAGHGALHLGCTARLAQQFVERGTAEGLDTRCVERYAPPPFVVVR